MLCVSRTYVDLVRHLDKSERVKLDRGELRLAQVHKEHLRRLAERRAQRQAELDAQIREEQFLRAPLLYEEYEAQYREIRELFARVGVDRAIDCLVDHCGGLGGLSQALDINLRRQGRDVVEAVINSVGSERVMCALNRTAAPQRIAAE